MNRVKLYEHQRRALEQADGRDRVALYHDCGLGKSFSGAELLHRYGNNINLVVCQKSMIGMWVNHFRKYYPEYGVIDYTQNKQRIIPNGEIKCVIVVNYELIWRRQELADLRKFTLLLDESSLIQHMTTKRTRFILKLCPKNVILLSGTPCSGKYENLLSQCRLLGWRITKKEFWDKYIISNRAMYRGYPMDVVIGYKNIDDLNDQLRDHGAQFLKTEDVFNDMPDQNFITISIPTTQEYKKFRKDRVVDIENEQLVGDTVLSKILYERMLCGQWNENKLAAYMDILESTNDRLVVFYTFTEELHALSEITVNAGRPISIVNGKTKSTDNFDTKDNAVIFVQWVAGSKGLNLQSANKMIFFSPTLSSEDYAQAQKRIHRIGQKRPCFYYKLTCKDSIEEWVYDTVQRGIDFTDKLFEERERNISK